MTRKGQSAGRRLSTITIDQVISGASNVLISILAARSLGIEAFGLFGIVFIIYVTAQGVSRALVCEPILVHPVEARERPGDAIGSAAVLGLGVGVLVFAVGLLAETWDRGLGNGLLVLGVCLPLLVLQDLGRYLGFATHRPGDSLVLDVVKLVLMVVAIGGLIAAGTDSLTVFIAAWAGSGAVAGLLVLWRHRHQKLRISTTWLRETWGFSWRYLVSYGAGQGAALGASIGIVAIAGVRTLGAVRGVLLVVSPINTFLAASVAAGVSEVSHLVPGSADVRRHVRRTTLLATAAAMVSLVVLVLLPDSLGRLVLGETWRVTEPLLLPAGVQVVLLGLITGIRSAMIGMKAIRITVRIDIASTVIILAGMLIGTWINGATGGYWAVAIGQGLIGVVWWLSYAAHGRKLAASPPVDERDASNEPTSPQARA